MVRPERDDHLHSLLLTRYWGPFHYFGETEYRAFTTLLTRTRFRLEWVRWRNFTEFGQSGQNVVGFNGTEESIVICHRFFGGRVGLRCKPLVGNGFWRGLTQPLAVLGLAIAVGCWCMPAIAEGPAGGSRGTQSFDELLNNKSATHQFGRWHLHGEGTYGAQQIVGDASLAQQLADDAVPSDKPSLEDASGAVKKHHLPTIALAILVLSAMLAMSAALLLIWSRIVRRQEMLDAPLPMAFNYPRN